MLSNLIHCNLDIYVKQIFLNVVFVIWPCEKGPNLYFVHTLFFTPSKAYHARLFYVVIMRFLWNSLLHVSFYRIFF